jgi:hypothetical protein
VSAFGFFLLGGIEALIVCLQLARPVNTVVGAETFNALSYWIFLTGGAGILPNNAGTRAAWIVNPQAIKRG